VGRFMITTPIYYVNAPMHLGHAYCTIACDAVARFRRLATDDVFFLTGLDEHGGNIEEKAVENGVTPQEWVDRIAGIDRGILADLAISNDDFIRTTEDRHRVATEEFWRKVAGGTAPDGQSNIYVGEYEGWYCRSCEAYYTESELDEGKCPDHKIPVEKVKEETCFFRLSSWAGKLVELFDRVPDFVLPDVRFNEVKGLLKEGLRDVSITRTRIKWGFPAPDHPGHVIYVWFDALMNYLTAIGYPDPKFRDRWERGEVIHVIGKEIMRFHALLWPAMLMAADLPLPRRIFAHGWWTVNGEKMSKTRGTGLDPREFAKKYSLDAVRYFLLAEMPFGHDGDFSERRLVERYNSDLANDFGNLAHRTISMAFRYMGGKVKRPAGPCPWEAFIRGPGGWPDGDHAGLYAGIKSDQGLSFVQSAFYRFAYGPLRIPQHQDALSGIWRVIKHGNKYLDTEAPWNKPPERQEEILGQVLLLLEAASWPLLAFIPDAALKLRRQLGLADELPPKPVRRAPLPEVFGLSHGDPLFPRIDTKKKEKK